MNKDKKLIPELRFPEFLNNKEWAEMTLGNIGEFIGGGTPDTSKSEYWNGDIQWYTPTEVKDGVLGKSLRTITKVGLNNSSAKLLPKGALLLTTRATIGDIAIANSECTTNQGFQSLVVKDSEINTFWYYWIIQHKNELKRKASGSTFPEIGKNEIVKIKAYRPDKDEQQKIASCLSSLDEVITAHSQKLELLKDHKKGLMQNLFPQEGEKVPKYRFKEFEKDGEWVEESLEYLTVKIGDGIHTTPKYEPSGEYYFVNGNNLIDGKIVVDEKTKRVSSEEFEIHKKDLTEKTIFLSINGTIGNLAFYNNEMVVLGKSACYITPNQKLNYVFLFYCLQSPRIIDYFFSEITGSTIKNLSLKSIRGTLINLPSEKEQQRIASCLSSLDALITAQAEKIEQLKLHKKGLMQGLFPKIND
ncbi:MAG: restriction endonuclease subunit S [Tenuifilaceae bacterium]|jgi:type I restriction enzyme S subunit|nr:restriction endonuclease subunit S [Tenuifilaceae bacterium]